MKKKIIGFFIMMIGLTVISISGIAFILFSVKGQYWISFLLVIALGGGMFLTEIGTDLLEYNSSKDKKTLPIRERKVLTST